jgi:hypothetical protein
MMRNQSALLHLTEEDRCYLQSYQNQAESITLTAIKRTIDQHLRSTQLTIQDLCAPLPCPLMTAEGRASRPPSSHHTRSPGTSEEER